ncbi:MAG TPA: hypothetical protein VGO47_14470 [Chlamydiales bacterium]|nr:hypothetical protein [Chlamydiales bacterium]
MSPTAAKLAEEAFQDVLGKKEDRYQSRGGTLFERSKHAKSVQRNIRCYTCTQSYERQPKLTSLTASLKLGRNGEPLDHNQQAKIKLTKVKYSPA